MRPKGPDKLHLQLFPLGDILALGRQLLHVPIHHDAPSGQEPGMGVAHPHGGATDQLGRHAVEPAQVVRQHIRVHQARIQGHGCDVRTLGRELLLFSPSKVSSRLLKFHVSSVTEKSKMFNSPQPATAPPTSKRNTSRGQTASRYSARRPTSGRRRSRAHRARGAARG